MKKNPVSEGFTKIGRGYYSQVYGKAENVEVTINGWLRKDKTHASEVEASKDIIIEARKLCNEESARYLPDARRKRISVEYDDDGKVYEFLYEMPLYEHSQWFQNYGNNELAKALSYELQCYNEVLSAKPGSIDKIIDYLVTKTWKDIVNKIDVANACNALLAISTASTGISQEHISWDLKPNNMAMNGNQMIFLDPIVCETPTKDILALWKKNGFAIPK